MLKAMREDVYGPGRNELSELAATPDDIAGEAAIRSIMDDLGQALKNLPQTQDRLMSLTGVGWSPDRMVKVEVGPRGQLVDLEIDPRVFRRPDAGSLKAAILAASAEAVRKVNEQAFEVMLGTMPPDLAELRARFDPDGADPVAQMLQTDADVVAGRRRRDGHA
jgi:hypothetical protein